MRVCARECEVGGSNYGNSKPTLEIEIEIDGYIRDQRKR